MREWSSQGVQLSVLMRWSLAGSWPTRRPPQPRRRRSEKRFCRGCTSASSVVYILCSTTPVLLQEAILAKEEEELKGLRKLRGADKVAARKTQAAAETGEDRARVASDAPTLTGRGLDAAIAVMTVAMGGASVSGSGSPARGGAGDASDDDAAAEHARDVAAVALLASGVDADDKHPEKRAKAAFKRFSERELEELKAEFPTLRRSQLQVRGRAERASRRAQWCTRSQLRCGGCTARRSMPLPPPSSRPCLAAGHDLAQVAEERREPAQPAQRTTRGVLVVRRICVWRDGRPNVTPF